MRNRKCSTRKEGCGKRDRCWPQRKRAARTWTLTLRTLPSQALWLGHMLCQLSENVSSYHRKQEERRDREWARLSPCSTAGSVYHALCICTVQHQRRQRVEEISILWKEVYVYICVCVCVRAKVTSQLIALWESSYFR